MKTRIISLALALTLILALIPAVLAATPFEDVAVYDWLNGTTVRFTASDETPNEFLGYASIGNLWVFEELRDWNFAVFVVEDETDDYSPRVAVEGVITEYGMEFYTDNPGMGVSELMLEDGNVILYEGFAGGLYDEDTDESMMIFDFHVRGDTLTPQINVMCLWDEDYEYLGVISYSAIVLTKSQAAAFRSTGKLPPVMASVPYQGMTDVSKQLDLTELKALLSGTPASKTVTPTASTVYVNGVEKSFEAYLIDGSNYFKLRDLATV